MPELLKIQIRTPTTIHVSDGIIYIHPELEKRRGLISLRFCFSQCYRMTICRTNHSQDAPFSANAEFDHSKCGFEYADDQERGFSHISPQRADAGLYRISEVIGSNEWRLISHYSGDIMLRAVLEGSMSGTLGDDCFLVYYHRRQHRC